MRAASIFFPFLRDKKAVEKIIKGRRFRLGQQNKIYSKVIKCKLMNISGCHGVAYFWPPLRLMH